MRAEATIIDGGGALGKGPGVILAEGAVWGQTVAQTVKKLSVT